ncbi:trypsin-like peptidase domain-containing protein [Nitrospira sp. Kam-Ns4a]
MRMMLYPLTGSLRGRTLFLNTESVSFGIGDACGVAFDPVIDAAVCPVHAELSVEDHTPIIRDRSGQNALFVNGQRVSESALRDGDLIQFGEGGPQVRFHCSPNGAPLTKPLKTIVADSRDIVVRMPHARYLSCLYLATHILRDIVRYASPAVKVGAAVLLMVPVAVVVGLGVLAYREHQAVVATERRMAELIGQLERGRLSQVEMERRIEHEREAAAELERRQEALLASLQAALAHQEAARKSERALRALRRQLAALQQERTLAEEIVRRFEGGVALLQGGYGFREHGTGRPLRYQGFDAQGNPLLDKDGNTLVTVEGTAPPVVIYFAGTAFLVDRHGTVVTNRHLVRMWEAYEPARQAIEAGFEPELFVLRLFFPDQPAPYHATVAALSERTDLAVLQTDRPPQGMPPLVLAPSGAIVHAGEPIVMLSYPGSFDTLLARASKTTSEEILNATHGDPRRLAEEVSKRGLIRPLVTRGSVASVTATHVAYEAAAATGSSGAPIFNRDGWVVAVNHATLQRLSGLHLAVPIDLAGELLAAAQGTR